MFKKLVLGFMVATLTLGLFPTLPASAAPSASHDVSSTCEELTVALSKYTASQPAQDEQGYTEYEWQKSSNNNIQWSATQPNGGWLPTGQSRWHVTSPASDAKDNTISVTINSVNELDTTFDTSFSQTFTYDDKYIAHDYQVDVVAWDGSGSFSVSETAKPCDNLDHTIDICHANEGIKEYVEQNVDFDSIFKQNGHAEHQDGRDIIPPFDYIKDGTPGHFDGLNWGPEGQAIYDAHCVVTPDKPEDKVDVDVKESAVDCETGLVTITTTTTTTGTELVDNEWVATEPEKDVDVTYRDATTEELESCIVIPTKPEDVVKTDVNESDVDCETELVTITTTTTTTGWILVDNQWVADEPEVSEETSTRDATALELLDCVVPEVPTTTDDDGDVLGASTGIKTLPNTSGASTFGNVIILSAIGIFVTIISIVTRSILIRRA